MGKVVLFVIGMWFIFIGFRRFCGGEFDLCV